MKIRELLRDNRRFLVFLALFAVFRTRSPTGIRCLRGRGVGRGRDNRLDSRYYGFVPRQLLIGRAHRILVSGDVARLEVRTERIGRKL